MSTEELCRNIVKIISLELHPECGCSGVVADETICFDSGKVLWRLRVIDGFGNRRLNGG